MHTNMGTAAVEDIKNILMAMSWDGFDPVLLLEANMDKETVINIYQAYRHGYEDAIRRVGIAFGISD